MNNKKFKNGIDHIKKWTEKVKREDFIQRTDKYEYDFQQYETIRSFDEIMYTSKINIDEAEMDQSNQ